MRIKYLPLFLLLILFIPALPFAVNARPAGVSSFFWLKPGTQAVYAFEQAAIIFDDCAEGHPFRGNYSWRCLEVNDTHAVLDVQVNLELYKLPDWVTPAHIDYFGTDFLESAARGDFSFIKRIPMDQVLGRVELYNSTANPDIQDGIGIPSPVLISKSFIVTVDLDTMMMTDESGADWGRWILWIDPFQYTLEGWQNPQIEPFVMNWLNTTVNAKVFYMQESDNMPINTLFGVKKTWFYAGVSDLLTNDFLSEQGWSSIFPLWAYERRTGLLLSGRSSDFIDDFLGQNLGLVALHSQTKNYLNLTSVKFAGDLNNDWRVNMLDVSIVAAAFNTRPSDQRWNVVADVNRDGVINIIDLSKIASVFGAQYITAD
jgi:hypothetical protein